MPCAIDPDRRDIELGLCAELFITVKNLDGTGVVLHSFYCLFRNGCQNCRCVGSDQARRNFQGNLIHGQTSFPDDGLLYIFVLNRPAQLAQAINIVLVPFEQLRIFRVKLCGRVLHDQFAKIDVVDGLLWNTWEKCIYRIRHDTRGWLVYIMGLIFRLGECAYRWCCRWRE
ncbi:hypothetical protein D3C85_1032740 [compost metagenome]